MAGQGAPSPEEEGGAAMTAKLQRQKKNPNLLKGESSPSNPPKKIVNNLTKSAHFLPISMKYSLKKLAKLFLDEITRL